jgi:hypothetical protein
MAITLAISLAVSLVVDLVVAVVVLGPAGVGMLGSVRVPVESAHASSLRKLK